MAKQSWFSDEGDDAAMKAFLDRMESWHDAMADGRVDEGELKGQAERVADLLRELDESLDEREHELATRALLEYAVLQAMQHSMAMSEARA